MGLLYRNMSCTTSFHLHLALWSFNNSWWDKQFQNRAISEHKRLYKVFLWKETWNPSTTAT